MLSFDRLCAWIDLPRPVADEVVIRASDARVAAAMAVLPLLHDPATWESGLADIRELLGPDEDGLAMLAVLLTGAADRYAEYRRLGIDDRVYVATMAFCSRFVREHEAVHGRYAFTWASWFPRQLALREFRFGALEYELVSDAGVDRIRLHVPADADLSRPALRASYGEARAELARLHPGLAGAETVCDSWLLSPALEPLLGADSRIRDFRSGFELLRVDPEDRSARRWVFGQEDAPTEDLPERTSLQRAVKRRLLLGEEIGAAEGRLRPDPWG